MKRILIAGIGNIFLGDDGFGCEVIRQLSSHALPDGVTAKDFGIRSYDLAYALVEDYATIILVDATPRGDATGTTYLIEIDPVELAKLDAPSPDAHSMNPVNALKMAQSLGPVTAKVFLVGCEPANLEAENGQIGLSETVQRAIPQAIETIEDLLRKELPGREIEKERVQVCA